LFIKNKNKLVNLDSVTSVVIEGTKVIFNLDYGISLRNANEKIIADYVYFFYDSVEEVQEVIKIVSKVFLNSQTSSVSNRYINPNKISFIKFEEFDKQDNEKNRIIVNFNVSVSFNGINDVKTSDSIYLDYSCKADYISEVKRFTNILEG